MNGLLNGDSEVVTLSNNGPGSMLRSSRRGQDLSVREMAEKLHLSQDLVRALEADDFDALPADVFTQGYLRKYARLLEEPLEPILEAYQSVKPSADTGKLKFTSGHKHVDMSSNHGLVRMMTWSIVIGLLVLMAFWWQGYLGDKSEALKDLNNLLSSDATTYSQQVVENDGDDSATDDEPILSNIEHTSTGTSMTSTDGQVNEPIEIPGLSKSTVTENTPSDSKPIESKPVVDDTPITNETSPVGIEKTVALDVESPQISLAFNSASWVDIRDKNGRSLLRGEIKSGTQHYIEGPSPYHFVLGKPNAVKITVNGTLYDMSRFSNGRVARFNLNP